MYVYVCTRGRLGVRAGGSVYARATRCTRGRFGVRADGSLYAGVCADGSVYARTCVDVCSLSEAVVGYVRVGGAASWACAHFSKVFRDCTGAVARTLWGLALAFLAFLHVPMRDGDALAHGVRRIGLPGTRSFVLRRVPLGWAGKPGAHFVSVCDLCGMCIGAAARILWDLALAFFGVSTRVDALAHRVRSTGLLGTRFLRVTILSE